MCRATGNCSMAGCWQLGDGGGHVEYGGGWDAVDGGVGGVIHMKRHLSTIVGYLSTVSWWVRG